MNNTDKRILILGNYPPPFGGVPRLIEGMVPYLVERGYEFTILSGGAGPTVTGKGLKVIRISIKNKWRAIIKSVFPFLGFILKYGSVFPYGTYRVFRAFVLSRYLGDEIRQGNLRLVCSYNLFLYGVLGHLIHKRYGLPHVIVNFGEIMSEGAALEKNPKFLSFVKDQVNESAARIAISRHCARSYEPIGLPPADVIASCIDVEHFKPAANKQALRADWQLPQQSFILGYLGRFSEQLGLHVVIAVVPAILQKYPQAIFVLGGARGELDQQAADLATQDPGRVFIFHDIPFSKLNEFYQVCDVLLSPSINERACGTLSSMEAMASEVPVIGSNMGGVPEVVIEGVSGWLFEANNRPEFTKKIEWVIENPSVVRSIGTSARKLMVQEYPVNKYNQQFDELFTSIMNSKS